jgi:hypothetical protein
MTRDEYVRSVGFGLRDLPWSTRRDLMAELRAHLAELPADTDLEERLGTPEVYAADLRSAAGLGRRRGLIAFLRARRPRSLVLSVAALTTIGLAIGGIVWVQSYQPLAFAGGSLYPAEATGRVGLQGQSVVFRQGRPFQFGITVTNTGRFPVRVLGVPVPPPGLPFRGRLMMSRELGPGVHGPYTGFRPFDLDPGQVRLLFFKGVLACRGGRANTGIGLLDFPVRFSFLWRTETAYLPLDQQLAVVFPEKFRCP